MIDATKFLAPDDIRDICVAPFYANGYEACTNGVCIVFTPCKEEHPDSDVKYMGMVKELLSSLASVSDWHSPPNVVMPEKVSCYVCKGEGKVINQTCDDCDGFGDITFFRGVHDYVCECKACDGFGRVIKVDTKEGETCELCGGYGHIYDMESYIDIDGVCLNPSFYELIINEEGLLISTDTEKRMLYFMVGEQLGVIMGKIVHKMDKEAA